MVMVYVNVWSQAFCDNHMRGMIYRVNDATRSRIENSGMHDSECFWFVPGTIEED